jgi:hypothetical protein
MKGGQLGDNLDRCAAEKKKPRVSIVIEGHTDPLRAEPSYLRQAARARNRGTSRRRRRAKLEVPTEGHLSNLDGRMPAAARVQLEVSESHIRRMAHPGR